MPLDRLFARACPFLLDSDTVRLQDFFKIDGTTLTDIPLNIAHQVSGGGSIVLGVMRTDHTVESLRRLARRNGVEDKQFDDLFGFLNLIGGLRFRSRTIWQRANATRDQAQALRLGIRYAGRSFRSRLTPASLLVAVLRAVWPVGLAIVVVGIELSVSGLVRTHTVIQVCMSAAVTFVISIYMHELGHVLALRYSRNELDVLQRRMHVGIIHAPLPYRTEIISALAGPFAGVLAAVSAGYLLRAIGFTQAAIATCSVAPFHLFSLLPWYGDGLSLIEAKHIRRNDE